MKQPPPTLFFVVCVVAIFALTFLWKDGSRFEKTNETIESVPTAPAPIGQPEENHPQTTGFLKNYASPTLPPENDLILIGDLLQLFQQTLKIDGSLPTGGNAEIVKALQGENPHREKFLPKKFNHLDGQGRLLDRWRSPIYFHFESAAAPEIRSAGPDQILWTTDDLIKLP